MLVINQETCLECGGCVALCPEEALFLSFNRLECDQDSCTTCMICVYFCPVGALEDNHAVAI